MNDDILHLLHRFVQTGGTNMLSAISLMKDAAAEIERLRAERDEAREKGDDLFLRGVLYQGEG